MKILVNLFKIVTLAATTLLITVCAPYDDTAVWDKINSLENRIKDIESKLGTINNDMSVLSKLVGSVTITSVVEVENGFRITFSDGTTYTITSGADGKVPTIGSNGNWWIDGKDTGIKASGSDGQTPTVGSNGNWWIDGKDTGVKAVGADGYTPVIGSNGNWWIGGKDTGVKASGVSTSSMPIIGIKEENGVYYWTQTVSGYTTWLLDGNGNKIPVAGQDGTSPILRVGEDGFWLVSYDKGKTFVYLLDSDGQRVKAECDCTNFFKSVSYIDGVLILILYDDTEVRIVVKEEDPSGPTNPDTPGTPDNPDTPDTPDQPDVPGYIDPRLPSVVPPDLLDKVDNYMPIYDGVNPPTVSGAYIVDQNVTVYCEDESQGGYAPGTLVAPMTFRFRNMDRTNNTVDYESYDSASHDKGLGAFISGEGNNFTAYFSNEGVVRLNGYEATYRIAVVMSGTFTSSGIKDCYYSGIMVEKNDPQDVMMDQGVFRIFKDSDGLASPASWDPPAYSPGLRRGYLWRR